jgi:hypothetical protein
LNLNPFFKIWSDLSKINENMLGLLNNWSCSAKFALWLDELNGIDQFSAAIALISLGIWEVAHWAFSVHKSISQESIAS